MDNGRRIGNGSTFATRGGKVRPLICKNGNGADFKPTVQKLFDLSGRTTLVTSGTGYLGRSLPIALVEAGANVVVTSRDAERARTTAAELPVVGAPSRRAA